MNILMAMRPIILLINEKMNETYGCQQLQTW
jgi:hypothetical protein